MGIMLTGKTELLDGVVLPALFGINQSLSCSVKKLRSSTSYFIIKTITSGDRECHFQLYLVMEISPFQNLADLAMLNHTTVISTLGYCNTLYLGPLMKTEMLQLVQNMAPQLLMIFTLAVHLHLGSIQSLKHFRIWDFQIIKDMPFSICTWAKTFIISPTFLIAMLGPFLFLLWRFEIVCWIK